METNICSIKGMNKNRSKSFGCSSFDNDVKLSDCPNIRQYGRPRAESSILSTNIKLHRSQKQQNPRQARPKQVHPYLKLCEALKFGHDLSTVFSQGNERYSRYYYRHCEIFGTYVSFFNNIGQAIQTIWKNYYDSKTDNLITKHITLFPGNSRFELSRSVYEGFADLVNHIDNLSKINDLTYYIACPSYITTKEYDIQQYIDCQPVITGKCLNNVDVKICCIKEMAEELGIIPFNLDKLYQYSQTHNVKIDRSRCDVYNFMLSIEDCVPYDGRDIIANKFEEVELFNKRVQIVVYGTIEQFAAIIPHIHQRCNSKDIVDLRAIRFVPLEYVKFMYPLHFENKEKKCQATCIDEL